MLDFLVFSYKDNKTVDLVSQPFNVHSPFSSKVAGLAYVSERLGVYEATKKQDSSIVNRHLLSVGKR